MRNERLKPEERSGETMLSLATRRSSLFHELLMYSLNPIAVILTMHSTQKTIVKNKSNKYDQNGVV